MPRRPLLERDVSFRISEHKQPKETTEKSGTGEVSGVGK
jgi:hypothetical protein